ncbi:hypothetical protein ACJX0J_029519, partial [Zea mays]
MTASFNDTLASSKVMCEACVPLCFLRRYRRFLWSVNIEQILIMKSSLSLLDRRILINPLTISESKLSWLLISSSRQFILLYHHQILQEKIELCLILPKKDNHGLLKKEVFVYHITFNLFLTKEVRNCNHVLCHHICLFWLGNTLRVFRASTTF